MIRVSSKALGFYLLYESVGHLSFSVIPRSIKSHNTWVSRDLLIKCKSQIEAPLTQNNENRCTRYKPST